MFFIKDIIDMKKFQLSAITASLMLAFSNAHAADINHTCNDQTQCNYGLFYEGYTNLSTNERRTERYWILNSNTEAPLGVYEDNLKLELFHGTIKIKLQQNLLLPQFLLPI